MGACAACIQSSSEAIIRIPYLQIVHFNCSTQALAGVGASDP